MVSITKHTTLALSFFFFFPVFCVFYAYFFIPVMCSPTYCRLNVTVTIYVHQVFDVAYGLAADPKRDQAISNRLLSLGFLTEEHLGVAPLVDKPVCCHVILYMCQVCVCHAPMCVCVIFHCVWHATVVSLILRCVLVMLHYILSYSVVFVVFYLCFVILILYFVIPLWFVILQCNLSFSIVFIFIPLCFRNSYYYYCFCVGLFNENHLVFMLYLRFNRKTDRQITPCGVHSFRLPTLQTNGCREKSTCFYSACKT